MLAFSLQTFRGALRSASFLPTLLILAGLTLGLTACGDGDLTSAGTPSGPLTDVTARTSNLSIIDDAIATSGNGDYLSDESIVATVFAPQNSAFDGLDVDEMTGDDQIIDRVVRQHVVGGNEVFLADITETEAYITLAGGDLFFTTSNGVTVNGISVVTPDLDATNGVAHIIDGVLLGRLNALERAIVTSDLELLQAAVEAAPASIATALQSDGNGQGLTVFAPSNAAFTELLDANDDGTVDNSEFTSVDLARVLQYHVLVGVTEAADIPTQTTTVETLLGETVDIVRNAQTGAVTLTLNDGSTVSVASADIGVRNGVVHTVDGVLVPPPAN